MLTVVAAKSDIWFQLSHVCGHKMVLHHPVVESDAGGAFFSCMHWFFFLVFKGDFGDKF